MVQASAVVRQGERANELINQRNPPPAGGNGADPGNDLQRQLADAQAQIAEIQLIVARQTQELSRMNGTLRAERKQFEEKIAGLTTELQEARKTPPADKKSLISQQEIELYGEGLTNLVDRVATERAKELAPPPQEPPSKTAETPPAEQPDPYFDVLRAHIRNFDARNNDPQFSNVWLKQPDPATKRTRMDLLQVAFQAMNTQQVAEIFNAYAEHREIGAGTVISPSPDANGGGQPPKPDDESEFVTPAEIAEHYRQKAFAKGERGIYVGKEGEKRYQRMEAKIAAAMKDGKVRAPATGRA